MGNPLDNYNLMTQDYTNGTTPIKVTEPTALHLYPLLESDPTSPLVTRNERNKSEGRKAN